MTCPKVKGYFDRMAVRPLVDMPGNGCRSGYGGLAVFPLAEIPRSLAVASTSDQFDRPKST